MLRKLWCWLVGWPCKWQSQGTSVRQREAYGVHISVAPNMVQEQVEVQRCERCGSVRSCRTVVG